MVSVQLNMTEAAIPTKESHPASLYKSTSSPVAAEEENILTMAMGISSEGIPICFVQPMQVVEMKSNSPEALRIPTATISPTSVGRIPTTVCMPSFAPFKKSSYTFFFIKMKNPTM